ncbi:MAG: hypothetical protein Q4G68_07275 [Planctomycetia bacterium]|nr:hypothetical protein [Planctomycetia bacterium]
MERRDVLKVLAGGTAGAVLAGTVGFGAASVWADDNNAKCERNGKVKQYPSSHFYKDGVLDQEAAFAAFFEMFEALNYSLTDTLRGNKDFWVADFGLGDFGRVGMGGIFWVNDKEHNYFAHEIYLLPNQMIPEHFHLPAEDMPAKYESWQVRYGSIYCCGKGGTKTDELVKLLPPSQIADNAITCFDCREMKVGDYAALSGLGDPHFMMGGPNGAIVTEYGSWHSFKGLGFTNKKAHA